MSRGRLEVRLSVFEGPTASIGALWLFAHLRGERDGASEYVVLCREDPDRPASRVCAAELGEADVSRLLGHLEAAGLPGRVPRVVANPSLLAEGPLLALAVRARGRSGSIDLPLRGAGFSGADAGPLRAAMLALADLAPIGRRASVRAVIGRALAVAEAPGRLRRDRFGPHPAVVPIGPALGSLSAGRGWLPPWSPGSTSDPET